MKKIAIICARKNSERVPNKNITLLNGKPLINYTVEAALTSKIFERVDQLLQRPPLGTEYWDSPVLNY
mgnify:CR=1 FL=1